MSDKNLEKQIQLANTVEVLQESEKRYRRLFESAKDGILILDADTGEVVDVNPFLLKLLGYSYGAICGQHIWELGVFKDIAASKDAFKTLQDNEYIRYEDLPLETLDRRPIAVEFVSNVYEVDHTKVIQCNIRDITERKRKDARLRDFAAIVESSDDAIISMTSEGRILTWNKAAERTYGYTAEEIVGQSVSILLPRDLPDELPEILAEVKSGEPVTHYETIRVRKDGKCIHVSLTISPVKDAEARIVGISTIARDITERKQAEKDLRESEEKYRQIVETANEGICVTDGDYLVTYVNQKMADMLGYLPEEIIDKPLGYFMFPEDVADHQEKISQRMQGENETYECRYRHKDGRECWTNVSATAIRTEDGRFMGSFAMLTDITEHKRTQEKVREQLVFLEALFDTIPNPIFYKDANGRYTGCNRAFQEFTGKPVEEYLGKTVYDMGSKDIADKYAEKDRELFEHPGKQHYEWQVQNTLGEVREVIFDKATLLDSKGAVTGLIGVISDITERKLAEDELRESKTFLTTLLNAIPVPVFYNDIEGRYIGFNRAFEKYIGKTRDQLFGKSAFDFTQHEFAEVHHAKDVELLQNPGTQIYESPGKDASGGLRDLIFHKATFMDTGGRVLGLIGVILDISGYKQAEKKRAQVEAQLWQAQKMEALGTLAGGIAHDFNNILGIIMGYTEIAKWESGEGSPVQGKLNEVIEAAKRATELVKQILAFSRKTEQQKMPLQLGIIVKDALRILRPSLPSTVEIKTEVLTNAAVLADPTQMHQVLMNLCANAAHAMQDQGGVLEVRLTDVLLEGESIPSQVGLKQGLYVELTVRDTGCGIDPAIIGSIFDPFFTTKETGKGTGLGLSVVHGIVESHEGQIDVESEPGKGTRFTVLIPALKNEYAPKKGEAQAALPRGQERVLVVDDEPQLAEIIKQMLERLGYQVDIRTNGIEALEAFRNQSEEKRFDLVLTDMTMPHITGIELAEELLKLDPNLAILICTGFSEKADAKKVKRMGIKGFLMKPVVLKDLAGMVRKVLDEKLRLATGL